jgi:hypothetical protein
MRLTRPTKKSRLRRIDEFGTPTGKGRDLVDIVGWGDPGDNRGNPNSKKVPDNPTCDASRVVSLRSQSRVGAFRTSYESIILILSNQGIVYCTGNRGPALTSLGDGI